MYRVFTRKTWRANPSWPEGYEPNPVPMDQCRTIETFEERQDAIDYCEERNEKWRKHSDRVRMGLASKTQTRTYYTANRYEFTEI